MLLDADKDKMVWKIDNNIPGRIIYTNFKKLLALVRLEIHLQDLHLHPVLLFGNHPLIDSKMFNMQIVLRTTAAVSHIRIAGTTKIGGALKTI